ncbi:MAG: M1 family metallopeptidase [Bacteroidota bacterium]
MRFYPIAFILTSLLLGGCKVNKNNTSANQPETRILKEITVTDSKKSSSYAYQESHPRKFDLIHTVLHLSFDYSKQYVQGKAILTLTPYFYDQKVLELDAHKFIIHRVALLQKDTVNVPFTYDDKIIRIDFKQAYSRKDTIKLFIDYTARPNEITEEGSAAISDAKGLYFINPLKTEPNKPRQIWSQGETQSNSGWFPTIDYPNERMTQELYLTVDATDITLSNGLLVYSKNNPNNTRTDYWSQKLPAAPYLTMIAIGEFTETRDFWRDSIEVNYYLEKAYQPYANLIFGSTPEMMECFSKRLGVDYPWEKFSQIVVRDFVSGAMENTSAVLHFDLVQHDAREHLDNPWEDIIAHELFHHWFGDLVTCESWSNIPMNESFATYGEYLWNEYKYGKMMADYDFDENLKQYLRQKSAHKKDLIRFHYRTQDDMFDVVSYQKGSRVLHMLRNYVGDDAFFASLKLYLTRNKFKSVEVHDLRLAFEEMTGEDLNWFFNQWFLNNGHPVLDVTYTYNQTNKAVKVTINQAQDTMAFGIFKLPVAIDIYSNGKATRHKVWVDHANWSAVFEADAPIELTNFDAEKMLLAVITENKTKEEYEYQLDYAPLYLDKEQAVDALIESKPETLTPKLQQQIHTLMNHSFYGMRELGIELLSAVPDTFHSAFETRLGQLAFADPKASVRRDAIILLSKSNNYKLHEQLFIKATQDSSYNVVAAGIGALADEKGSDALVYAKPYLNTTNKPFQLQLSSIIAEYGKDDYTKYFEEHIKTAGHYTYAILSNYAVYLKRQDSTIVLKAIPGLTAWYQSNKKSMYKNVFENLKTPYTEKYEEATAALKGKKVSEADKAKWIQQQQAALSMMNHIERMMKSDDH